MGKTSIEWADKVWNPTVGCTKVSQGCKNCYAKTLHDRRHEAYLAGKKVAGQYAQPFETVQLMPERLNNPRSWQKRQRIFVNSVSDLFHPDVPDRFIEQVWMKMMMSRHTFMVLTKRHERMRDLVTEFNRSCMHRPEPDANIWLGVSVEDQQAADERIPFLLQTPAAVRFVSGEPLLGPVDVLPFLTESPEDCSQFCPPDVCLDWVICGGESGPNARPMHPDWARGLRDQCTAAGVPFFFKQWGEWGEVRSLSQKVVERYSRDVSSFPNGDLFFKVGKKHTGRLLDGREWNEYPTSDEEGR